MKSALRWVGVALLCGLALPHPHARAEDSAYCRKVRARAASDASLLSFPHIIAEAIRFPSSHHLDIGPTVGENIQPRVGVLFAPLDLYRANRLTAAAEADCQQHEIGETLRTDFAQIMNPPELEATRAQAAYLEGRAAEWRKLLEAEDARLRAGTIMIFDVHELRRFAMTLERKLTVARAQVTRLAAQPSKPGSDKPWSARIEAYQRYADELDRALSTTRSLDAWTLKLNGGVIPSPGHTTDWFGYVQLGYALGGIGRNGRETDYIAAHRAELIESAAEFPARAAEIRKLIAAEIASRREELAEIETELRSIEETRTTLGNVAVPQAEHTRALLTVEEITVEADRAFLRTLLDGLERAQIQAGSS
jgi:hypothetical protein